MRKVIIILVIIFIVFLLGYFSFKMLFLSDIENIKVEASNNSKTIYQTINLDTYKDTVSGSSNIVDDLILPNKTEYFSLLNMIDSSKPNIITLENYNFSIILEKNNNDYIPKNSKDYLIGSFISENDLKKVIKQYGSYFNYKKAVLSDETFDVNIATSFSDLKKIYITYVNRIDEEKSNFLYTCNNPKMVIQEFTDDNMKKNKIVAYFENSKYKSLTLESLENSLKINLEDVVSIIQNIK